MIINGTYLRQLNLKKQVLMAFRIDFIKVQYTLQYTRNFDKEFTGNVHDY